MAFQIQDTKMKFPATVLPNVSIRDLSQGMVSNAYAALLPDNVCYRSINLNFDKLGGAQTRLGTTMLGAAVSPAQPCQGLGQLFNSSGSLNFAVAAFNGTNYAWDGATWTGIGAAWLPARGPTPSSASKAASASTGARTSM